ncbi:MAG: Arc family DNA-binding protein [Acidobacteria bacterium]|nr:Arc family DNA-binding protein [Acidobacteriota bacterium]
MATLSLKNVPDKLYERLKKSAAENHRSINREAIACLEQTVGRQRRDPAAVLEELRAFRRTLGRIYVTDQDLDAAKREGRL